MKSKTRRRVIALVLCMVMLLSCGVTTLAEGNTAEPAVTGETAAQENISAEAQADTAADDAAVVSESQEKMAAAETAETETEETASSDVAVQSETAEETESAQTEESTAADTTEQTAGTESGDASVQSEEEATAGNDTAETSEPETSTENETQADTAEKTEKAAQPYSGEYEDDTIKISVSAEAGIVPEGAKLSVTPIEKTEITDDMTAEEKAEAEKINDQYELTEKKLNEDSEENEETMEGFLAYDISFLVNGEEVEPSGDVNVVMEFREAAIPEGVSEDAAVTVKHLKEDETAEDGVVVEDMADKAEVKATEKAEVEKVELTANSFSTFTITWTYDRDWQGNPQQFKVRIHYTDEDGNPIKGMRTEDITGSPNNNSTIDLSQYQELAGYEHLRTVVDSVDSEKYVSELRYREAGNLWKTYYVDYRYRTSSYSEWTNWLHTGDDQKLYGDIYIVYRKISESEDSDIKIVDNIKTTGLLTATVVNDELQNEINSALESGETVEYIWYKSDNGADFTEVTLNKSGEKYNLQGDYNQYLDVVIDGADKARETKYKVELLIKGEKKAESSEFEIQYYKAIQNGDFETPDSDRGSGIGNQWSNKNYKAQGGVWQTTGIGGEGKKGQDIEVLYVGTGGQGAGNNFMDDDASDKQDADGRGGGSQYAEINCEAAGALYQDVLTDTQVNLNYYLSHRARSQNKTYDGANEIFDTMYLVIMPTKTAESFDTHSELVEYLNGDILNNPSEIPVGPEENECNEEEATILYNQNGVFIARITSDADDWHDITPNNISTVVSGANTRYKPTSSLSRFFFISGATYAAGVQENAEKKIGDTIGNLVDEIAFGQIALPAEDGTLEITINKTVTGLTPDQFETLKNQLTFNVSSNNSQAPLAGTTINANGEGNPSGVNVDWTTETAGDGSPIYKMSCVLSANIDWDGSYTYTVEETDYAVEGTEVTRNTEILVSGDATKTENSVTLGERDSAVFNFTNDYTAAVKKEPVNFFLNLSSTIMDTDGNIGTWDNKYFTKSVAGSFTKEAAMGVEDSFYEDLEVVVPEDHKHPNDNNKYVWGVIGSENAENALVSDAQIRQLGTAEGYSGVSENGNPHTFKIINGEGNPAFPSDEDIFAYIQEHWNNEAGKGINKGNPIVVNGRNIYDPTVLNTTNFTIRWYVFKDQNGGDYWHIDGILVPKSGILKITKTFENEEIAQDALENDFKIKVTGEFLTGETETLENTLTGLTPVENEDGSVTYTWNIAVFKNQYTVSEENYSGWTDSIWDYQNSEYVYTDAQNDSQELEAPDNSVEISTTIKNEDESVASQTLAIKNNYVTGLDLEKVSFGTVAPIDGAIFSLSEKNDTGEWIEIFSNIPILNSGEAELQNLKPGAIYKLEEVNAPAEHVKLEESIYFTVTGNGVELCGEDGVIGDESSDMWRLIDGVLTIKNKVFYELPEAGGSGIYWYMLGGVLLMMAGSLLVYKKRRGEVLRRK